MRIVIDLQGAQGSSKDRGIGRYSLEFALAVARNRNDHDVIIALNGMFPEAIDAIRHSFYDILPASNIRVWNGIGPATGHNPSDRSRREVSKLLRESFLESLQPDIVHITSLFEGFGDHAVHSVPQIKSYLASSTFYDLIPFNNASIYLDNNQDYKSFYLNVIAELIKVDLHLSISQYSSSELIDSLQVDPERVRNVYAGVNDLFARVEKESSKQKLEKKFGIAKPYLMYSGASDERKNHLRLIEAFSQSRFKNDYQLVLVGRMPPETAKRFKDHSVSFGLDNNEVVITNTVSDDELVNLYNNCALFVFPAWQEGFGLPLVEAMKCGAPVIGSNTSSIPEVIGDPDALFDPFDVKSIRDAIDRALDNPAFLERMRAHGLKRASVFSWDQVGSDAIAAFEVAAKGRSSSATDSGCHSRSSSHAEFRKTAINAVRYFLGNQKKLSGTSMFADWRPLLPVIEQYEVATISRSIALNHPIKEVKQIFVDVSELVNRDAKTGIQRVVRSILYELINNPPEGYQVEPVYACTGQVGYRYARAFYARMFGGIYTPLPDDFIDVKSGDIFIGLDLQHHSVLSQAEAYKMLRNNGVEIYFIVYDLLPVLMPNKFPDGAEVIHDQWLTAISREADGLICISRAVADELVQWLDQHGLTRSYPLKIGWFHLGADVMQSMPSKGVTHAPQSFERLGELPTFLMVGTLEPRKGHAQTLAAFEKLWADGHDINLVIVGKQGWNVEKLVKSIKASKEFGDRLLWLSSVSDDTLEELYAAADCLIAASEGEGFGLPLVEAAQHKLHIVARSLPVFREVAGEAAFYFDGHDPASMSQALRIWLDRFKNEAVPRSDGMRWLTWKQSTGQLLSMIMQDNWYRTWVSGAGWRLTASDPSLCTVVGSKVGQELHTTGREGYLLFGPFLTLGVGTYRCRIFGDYRGKGEAKYDLVGSEGNVVLAKGRLNDLPNWGELLSIKFDVSEEIRRFEVRIFVEAHAHIRLSRLEIYPIDSDSSENNLGVKGDFLGVDAKDRANLPHGLLTRGTAVA
ncbi:glycosyltransferase family 4 protein [Sphingobium sp. TB-6]|uniref:glycosyltransferase family 4 protein n=1 Tax=Sphingobium sp. TB-6 TaxID=2728850 RepID=UPI00146B22F4|nr:glycosyltransferase family 1 protein [Sphingobium sp. TB-6]NML88105.1 glycosyltransferase family 4 protein [Sphingobium sp. TB-6]